MRVDRQKQKFGCSGFNIKSLFSIYYRIGTTVSTRDRDKPDMVPTLIELIIWSVNGEDSTERS